MSSLAASKFRKHKFSYQEDRTLQKVSSEYRIPFLLKRKLSRQSTDTEPSYESLTKNKKINKIQDFDLIRTVGRGTSGKVFLAIHKETGFVCAIKKICKKSLKGDNQQETFKIRNQLIREIKLQSFMDHPNLIKLYTIFDDSQNIYMVMEAGTDGQLFSLIYQSSRPTQETTSFIVKQILEGINYMHDQQIIHRDIKLQNILLSFGTVKLCDFGWSVYCSKEIRSTLCGTPLYFSPELLEGKKYDQKVDIWAIGIITHELLTGQNPFHIKRKEELIKVVTEHFQMKQGSQSLRYFMEAALEKAPEKRVSAKDLLKHPFIIKYSGLDSCDQLNELMARNSS